MLVEKILMEKLIHAFKYTKQHVLNFKVANGDSMNISTTTVKEERSDLANIHLTTYSQQEMTDCLQ